jgi:peptidoglycan/xylan/chitin deacetylase (PgdA/CDA1 family)
MSRRLVVATIAAAAALLLAACTVPPPAPSSGSLPGPAASTSSATPGSTSGVAAAPGAASTTSAAATPSVPTTGPVAAKWEAPYRGKIIRGFTTPPGYKAVALTFDDGPNHQTRYIVNTLEQYGGKATFFDTGKLLARPGGLGQAKLADAAGFEIGDHTQHHTINSISSLIGRTFAQDVVEITGPDNLLIPVIGHPTLWLRPMGGEIDANGIRAANATGHLVIDWTLDSMDSHGWNHTPDQIFHNVTTGIVSGDVVLMHVTHPESMKALPRICQTLTAEGFQLVTLSELASHSTPFTGERLR